MTDLTRLPLLTIDAGRGVTRVVVQFSREDRDAGFTLLRRALPALRQLDRRTETDTRET